MSLIKAQSALLSFVSFFAFCAVVEAAPRYSHTGPTLISNVTIIDGLGNPPVENRDILIEDGKIAAIGVSGSLKAPEGALVVEGQGLTAMPGLMDLHIHTQGGWANGVIPGERYAPSYEDEDVQQRLNGYVYAGVTTVLDTGADHNWVVGMRDRINSGDMFGPRHFTTGVAWSSAPSGWDAGNTSGGDWAKSTIVGDLDDLPEQVAKYKADNIEILKAYAGIGTVGLQALVAEAENQGLRVIADLWMLNLNKQILQTTGLHGWAHTGGFDVAPIEDHEWMTENDRFVVATVILGELLAAGRVADEDGSRAMLDEPLIVDIWGPDTVEEFYTVYPQIRENYYDGKLAFYQLNNFGNMERFRPNMQENARRAIEAGVLLGCGTDDVYPGAWPGESTHREMQLLVMGGVSPLQAIKACTSDSAKILKRESEFGSLQVGLVADILLVEGNPAENIDDTKNVREVFMVGKQVDRASLALNAN
jgi:imidazolonepropionase-like amidohydrolase